MNTQKIQVLFICSHNSCRSQMAEGILNHFCGDFFHAQSAGIKKTHVHPLAIQVMNEIDIDISNQQSKHLDEFRNKKFDVVATVCDSAKETCPFYPGKKIIHQSFFDPSTVQGSKEKQLTTFRKTRDEIKQWLQKEFCDTTEIKHKKGEINVE
jgi:arsenate reductase (thioredoxin)